jgi:hypothetical protein
MFSVELSELEHVAVNLLPAAAEDVSRALNLAMTLSSASSGEFEGELYSEFEDHWASVTKLLVDVLDRNMENLECSGVALAEIVRRYREADGSAAARTASSMPTTPG